MAVFIVRNKGAVKREKHRLSGDHDTFHGVQALISEVPWEFDRRQDRRAIAEGIADYDFDLWLEQVESLDGVFYWLLTGIDRDDADE